MWDSSSQRRCDAKFLVLGQYANAGNISFNPHAVTRKQLQMVGSWGFEPRHVDKALTLLETTEWKDHFARQITHRFPLEEIQDQVGCRVVVKTPKARRAIALLLAAHFGHLEKGYKVDKDPRVFGYAAHHVVCPIPEPLLAKENLPTQAFEIQVSTLFQFAWSQMEHALGYKSGKRLTKEQRRNLAAAAALAETADVLFSRVREASRV